ELYGPEFLIERPLLRALRAGPTAVLLIDEIDRADDEFEAFLLEVLSDFSVTVPELGTIAADQPPVVIVTSNRTRELHDALKRRCLRSEERRVGKECKERWVTHRYSKYDTRLTGIARTTPRWADDT